LTIPISPARSPKTMRMSNPFLRAFLVGAIWFAAVSLKMVSRHSGHWSTFPLENLRFVAIGWIVTAVLLGFAGQRFQTLRSWSILAVSTLAGSLAVMGLILALVSSRPKQAGPPQFATTDEMMVYFAKEAAKWVKQDKGIELDYSMSSIKVVEEQLGGLSRQVDKSNPQKGMFGQAASYGAYIGEVVRKRFGGTWAVDHPVGGARSYPMTTKSNQVIFPVGWCWKRIINGEEDNVYFKAEMLLLPNTLTNVPNAATNGPSGVSKIP
jgi:hypothetical protein